MKCRWPPLIGIECSNVIQMALEMLSSIIVLQYLLGTTRNNNNNNTRQLLNEKILNSKVFVEPDYLLSNAIVD